MTYPYTTALHTYRTTEDAYDGATDAASRLYHAARLCGMAAMLADLNLPDLQLRGEFLTLYWARECANLIDSLRKV